MRRRAAGTAVLGALVALAPLAAQSSGAVAGRAVDLAGGPVAGVEVAITGTALVARRSVLTARQGRFVFPGLPPGTYQLRAVRAGYASVEQTDLRVRADRTVLVRLEMIRGEEDEVSLTASPPSIDRGSVTPATSLGTAALEGLPLSRNTWHLAEVAPGAVSGGVGAAPSLVGLPAAAGRFFLDGLDVSAPSAAVPLLGAPSALRVPLELVEGAEVEGGGLAASYGGALAGVVSLVTRPGGRRLGGRLFAYRRLAAAAGRRHQPAGGDLGASLGGSLAPRLWFFAGGDRVGSGEAAAVPERTADGLGRLTWSATPGQQLSFFALRSRAVDRARRPRPGPRGLPLLVDRLSGEAAGLDYGGVFGGRWLVSAGGGSFHSSLSGADAAGALSDEATRREARGSVGWSGGGGRLAHEVRFGAARRRLELDLPAGLGGLERGFFAEDRMRVGERLVVLLGVRADDLEGGVEAAPGDTVAPRFGLTWDPYGEGRAKLFASWGLFYQGLGSLPPAAVPETGTARVEETQLGWDHELLPYIWITLRGVVRDLEGLPAEGRYRAVEATLNKGMRSGWQLHASYVLAASDQRQPGAPSFRPTAFDRRQQVKVYGSFRWPSRLTTGFVVESFSGLPVDALEPGSGHTAALWHADLHLEYPLDPPGSVAVRLVADAFNLTDRAAPLGGLEGDERQGPRRVRLGARLSW